MAWYLLNDQPVFFENEVKGLRKIEAPDKKGGAWKTKTGERRKKLQKPKLEEE